MRILVTGASSFVGAHFCRRASQKHDVLALHHSTPLQLNGVTPVRVDLRRARDQARLAALNADAVVHLAARIQAPARGEESKGEAAARVNRLMMDAVLSLGLPVAYASSTVVHWTRDTPYARIRREDEARLAASGLPWGAVRPSAPYGPRLAHHKPRHKESFQTLADLVRRSPLVPVIGDGKYRRQPIHVDDLSDGLLAVLERWPGAAYDAGGGDALTMDEIVATLGRLSGRSARPLHLPKALFVQAARFLPDFDAELLSAADEDELADPTAMTAALGVTPRVFAAGARDLLR